ncbi:unnamed protein product [Protopolystoma xenopodis]|uniref:RRM domain-containing protein n=1 Tax=Protopolystoma xenopodis TaxID=117903 RepID=A0A448XCT3_9PLAT|nr:unnamed protein product [Protopolystoma xenopodis]
MRVKQSAELEEEVISCICRRGNHNNANNREYETEKMKIMGSLEEEDSDVGITDVCIIRDPLTGRSRGFGYLELATAGLASRLLCLAGQQSTDTFEASGQAGSPIPSSCACRSSLLAPTNSSLSSSSSSAASADFVKSRPNHQKEGIWLDGRRLDLQLAARPETTDREEKRRRRLETKVGRREDCPIA